MALLMRIGLSAALVALLATSGEALAAQPRPNVLLIMTDDQGYGDLACHGNPYVRTPNLDRLAGESIELTRFYVSPVCAPTRSSLLTGRYSLRCGVWGVTKARENMHADEVTLAEVFSAAGYATGCFGKWHNGEFFPLDPNGQGFDEFLGFCGGQWNWYFDPTLDHNNDKVETNGYITDILADAAIDFIRANRERPFFCYVPFNAPHTPNFVPERYREPYKKMGLGEPVVSAYAMIESVDDNVGRMLAALDELKISDRTIVVFLTDNGPNGERYNADLRGRKASLYEGGVRVPFFIRYPAALAAGKKIDTIAAHIDVLPTLVELCALDAPQTLPLDGKSLAPILRDPSAPWRERMLFGHREGGDDPSAAGAGCVRTQKYNLIAAGRGGERWELFDVEADPSETQDLAKELPEVAARLKAAYDEWYAGLESDRIYPRRAVPIGHAEENPVYLRPPEAIDSRGVRFIGNDGYRHDWFTDWTSIDGYVDFDLDVATAGEYEVALAYRTPHADVGSKVRVSAAGQSIEATLDQGVEPVRRGDFRGTIGTNVPTLEWSTAELGRLKLPSGKTRLRLEAIEMPGESVMDFNHLRVTKIK